MAQKGAHIEAEKLSCSICLKILQYPVTIPCGHSYCMLCISRRWTEEGNLYNSFSCPLCRRNFNSRPALRKNIVLSGLVEDLKKKQAAADPSNAGPHMSSDLRTTKKRRNSKDPSPSNFRHTQEKKHKPMEPSKSPQEYLCSKHKEEKKIFCRTDQKCICYLCHIEDHKGHDAVSAETEMTQRQKELHAERQKINQRVQVVEKDIGQLQQELKTINESAAKATSENHKMTTALTEVIKEKSSDLTRNIQQQQNIKIHHTQELLTMKKKELQQQKPKSAKLELLSQTVSYTDFLENCPASFKSGELPITSSLQCQSVCDFEEVSKVLSEERRKLHHICTDLFKKVTKMVVSVDAVHPQNPKTSEEFSHLSHQLKLDPNTASTHLALSEDNTNVTSMKDPQPYPKYLDRFIDKSQVLSSAPLPTRCYWEVQWSGLCVSVGVTYNDIKRAGPESGFGNNDKSWVLDCATNVSYIYRHKDGRRVLSACESFRVGIFLDYNAGILIFYEVSETNKVIHKIQTKFTQPLYAGLGLCYTGSTAKMCVKE